MSTEAQLADKLSAIDVSVTNALNLVTTLQSEIAGLGPTVTQEQLDALNAKADEIVTHLSSVPAASGGLVPTTGADVSTEDPGEPTQPEPGVSPADAGGAAVDPSGAQPGTIGGGGEATGPPAEPTDPNAPAEA